LPGHYTIACPNPKVNKSQQQNQNHGAAKGGHDKKPIFRGKPDQLNSMGNISIREHLPTSSCTFESRDEILLKGGRLWRPRFLISIINANDRFSWVKPSDIGPTMVKGTVKPYLNPYVFERPLELLPRSPNFT
jgi:hypothetical protein